MGQKWQRAHDDWPGDSEDDPAENWKSRIEDHLSNVQKARLSVVGNVIQRPEGVEMPLGALLASDPRFQVGREPNPTVWLRSHSDSERNDGAWEDDLDPAEEWKSSIEDYLWRIEESEVRLSVVRSAIQRPEGVDMPLGALLASDPRFAVRSGTVLLVPRHTLLPPRRVIVATHISPLNIPVHACQHVTTLISLRAESAGGETKGSTTRRSIQPGSPSPDGGGLRRGTQR